MIYESIFMWTALIAYALSAALNIIAVTFGKRWAELWGWRIAAFGAVFQTAAIIARWVRIGHGPYLGFYEVAGLLCYMGVVFYLLLSWRYPGLSVAGAAIMPVSLLIIGGAMLASKDADPVTGSLASIWLGIHVLFANLAYGAYAAAFILSAAYLMREHSTGHRFAGLLERFPRQEVIDSLTFKFVGAGFLFQGVMIASGAIWANEAWGRYWAWDPMETWSLIAWAVYAIYLHLRLTMGWKGERAAWVAVISLPVIVFSLLGVPLVYNSIHGAYLKV